MKITGTKKGVICNGKSRLKSGERGIRTLDTPLRVYSLSRGALSTTQPSLRVSKSNRFKNNKYRELYPAFATQILNNLFYKELLSSQKMIDSTFFRVILLFHLIYRFGQGFFPPVHNQAHNREQTGLGF